MHVACKIGWSECALNLVHRGASLCAADNYLYDPHSSFFQSLVISSTACSLHYTSPPVTAIPLLWRRYACFTIFWPRKTACLGSMPSISMPALFLFHSPIIPPNRYNSTPLDRAADYGHLETVRVLIRQGATVFEDDLLDNISRKAQEVVAQPCDDILRLRENWKPISFALRRVLFIQRKDAD